MRSPLTKGRSFQHLVALILLSLSGCGSDSDRVIEETVEQLYKIGANTNISIQNRDGAILVYGSNTDEMQVHATKKAYSRARLKEIAIEISAQPTSVSINVKFPPKPTWALFDRSGTVDCTVVLPAAVNISVLHLDTGELLVDGMHGPSVRAWLGDGRMFAHNCFSNTNLELRRGNLAISFDWWEHRAFSIHANVGRGNAWAFLPSDAAFHLVAETVHGKLASDFDSMPVARAASSDAKKIDTLVHGGGQAAINLRAANGDIKIVEANP